MRLILWYGMHVTVVSIAAMALLQVEGGGIAVIVMLLFTVSTIAAIVFAVQSQLTFRVYAWPVAASGLTLSLALLVIDWAASTADHAITFFSFMSYLAAAILSPALVLIAAPTLLLVAAAALGMVLGRSIKRQSDRVRIGRMRP